MPGGWFPEWHDRPRIEATGWVGDSTWTVQIDRARPARVGLDLRPLVFAGVAGGERARGIGGVGLVRAWGVRGGLVGALHVPERGRAQVLLGPAARGGAGQVTW